MTTCILSGLFSQALANCSTTTSVAAGGGVYTKFPKEWVVSNQSFGSKNLKFKPELKQSNHCLIWGNGIQMQRDEFVEPLPRHYSLQVIAARDPVSSLCDHLLPLTCTM
mmetsp:Transcript_23389/g.35448  ORF Transcript_23389/g.35448 Transcript_23389/m.35448 type:complete len:109 (+) Transcript_23389:4726-5052(+)